MTEKEAEPSYYAVIPAPVRYAPNLPPQAKLLFGEISALCNKLGYCWASNQYFSKLYGVDDRTVRRWIAGLEKEGFVYSRVSGKLRKIVITEKMKDVPELTDEPKKPRKKKELVCDPLGAEIIKAFEAVDPKNKGYYGNTTQRGACDFLLKEYGLEETLKRVGVLARTNGISYFPTITTPAQLRDKWVQLQAAADRKKQEAKGSTRKTAQVAFV